MPRSGSIDIPHVTVTDHFIRKPVKKTDVAGVKKFLGLVAINEKDPSPKVKAEAYINQFEKFDHNPALLDSAMRYLSDKSKDDLNLLVHLYYLKNDLQNITALASKYHTDASKQHSYDNKDAWTFYRIADAYDRLGNIKTAHMYYMLAKDLAPHNPEFLNKFAGSLYKQNEKEEAQKMYRKIIEE